MFGKFSEYTNYLRLKKQVRIIERSGFFDEKWYEKQYLNSSHTGSPVWHYVTSGVDLGYDPGPKFNTEKYLNENPDVKESLINPLFHYITTGKAEGRHVDISNSTYSKRENRSNGNTAKLNLSDLQRKQTIEAVKKFFDPIYYLLQNVDVRLAAIDPYDHFIWKGFAEGRNPAAFIHLNFMKKFYNIGATDLELFLSLMSEACFHNALLSKPVEYQNVKSKLDNPAADFSDLLIFDVEVYIKFNPDVVANADMNPIGHLYLSGLYENRLRKSKALDLNIVNAPDSQTDLEIVEQQEQPFKYIGFSNIEIKRPDKSSLTDVHLAIGIVLYQNTKTEVLRLTQSILNCAKQFEGNITIYYLDNSPKPLALKYLKIKLKNTHYELIECPENIGFSLGHNKIMSEAFKVKHTHYLGLNPDGYLLDNALSEALWFSKEQNDLGMIELKNEPLCHPKHYDPTTGRTDWISGAAFLFSKVIYDDVKGFDPDFPMYAEDIDLSLRTRIAGYGLFVCQHAQFYHDVTGRIDEDDLDRKKRMLIGNWYLCKKWGAESRAAIFKAELQRLEFDLENLPKVKKHCVADTKITALFKQARFSRSRYWK